MNNNRLYTKNAMNFAKEQRKSGTDAEKVLWFNIRNNRLNGIKFKRQVPIGKYIVDFLCVRKKLIIELDGSQHIDNEEYDNVRTDYLSQKGYTVLRFYDDEVLKDISTVLGVIKNKYDKL